MSAEEVDCGDVDWEATAVDLIADAIEEGDSTEMDPGDDDDYGHLARFVVAELIHHPALLRALAGVRS